MPVLRPPYPVERGLEGRPTLVNNVETLALLPWIFRNGAEAFAALGTERSRGTKVFSLAGKVARGGLIEVPMGITIREIVEEIGGGVPDGEFKAVQVGGPSGGCIPAALADTPIDYEALIETGAMMGSGGLVVLDDHDCMVDMARYFLQFTQNESCGKCTFCRIGTRQMLDILERICRGRGRAARPRRPRGPRPDHERGQPLRPRARGAQPGAHDAPLLPRRVRGAPRGPVPRRPMPRADLLSRDGRVHRLHDLRPALPGGRHPLHALSEARDRHAARAPPATSAAACAPKTRSRCAEMPKLQIDGRDVTVPRAPPCSTPRGSWASRSLRSATSTGCDAVDLLSRVRGARERLRPARALVRHAGRGGDGRRERRARRPRGAHDGARAAAGRPPRRVPGGLPARLSARPRHPAA